MRLFLICFFFQAEDGIRDYKVTGVQTCALPICRGRGGRPVGWYAQLSGLRMPAHGAGRRKLVVLSEGQAPRPPAGEVSNPGRRNGRSLAAGFFAGQPFRLAAAIAMTVVLAGCTQAPPPPLVTTPAARTSVVLPTDTSRVVVGVDGIGGGYNPHELSDQSAVTTALSTLLLPSVFRTAPDGTPTLDHTLMVSAEVTNASPFTVVYQVRTDA